MVWPPSELWIVARILIDVLRCGNLQNVYSRTSHWISRAGPFFYKGFKWIDHVYGSQKSLSVVRLHAAAHAESPSML